jgi:hypothetical protein
MVRRHVVAQTATRTKGRLRPERRRRWRKDASATYGGEDTLLGDEIDEVEAVAGWQAPSDRRRCVILCRSR